MASGAKSRVSRRLRSRISLDGLSAPPEPRPITAIRRGPRAIRYDPPTRRIDAQEPMGLERHQHEITIRRFDPLETFRIAGRLPLQRGAAIGRHGHEAPTILERNTSQLHVAHSERGWCGSSEPIALLSHSILSAYGRKPHSSPQRNGPHQPAWIRLFHDE